MYKDNATKNHLDMGLDNILLTLSFMGTTVVCILGGIKSFFKILNKPSIVQK